jgi:hypothetical protein
MGNYFSGDPTELGLGAQLVTGLIDIDLPCDIRDIFYDLTHWEWSLGHGFQTTLDAVGLLPVFGVLKYADEAGALLKQGKYLSVNQADQLIRKGKAPKSIIRVDKGKVFGEQDNIHFADGSAINRDGTFKHGGRTLTKAEKDFLLQAGFTVP